MNQLVKVFQFESRPLTVITYKGRPAFIGKEVEERMGYAPKGLSDLARGEWGDEIVYGDDFVVVTGEELADLKKVLQQVGGYPTSRARSMMLFFESGVHAVALLSRKPEARRLRKFLSSEVMPQLARDGRFSPDRTVTEAGELVGRETGLAELSVKERVMLMDAETRRLDAETRRARIEVMSKNADTKEKLLVLRRDFALAKRIRTEAKHSLSVGEITKSEYYEKMVLAADAEAGVKYRAPKVVRDEEEYDLKTCAQIGKTIGMSAVQVGKMIARMDAEIGGAFKADPRYFEREDIWIVSGGVKQKKQRCRYTADGIRMIIDYAIKNGYGNFGTQCELPLGKRGQK